MTEPETMTEIEPESEELQAELETVQDKLRVHLQNAALIRDAELACQEAEEAFETKKAESATARKLFEARTAELRALIRRINRGESALPFEDEQAESAPAQDLAGEIEVATALELTDKQQEAFTSQGILTVIDFEHHMQHCNERHQSWWDDLAGIGEQTAMGILETWEDYRMAHPKPDWDSADEEGASPAEDENFDQQRREDSEDEQVIE